MSKRDHLEFEVWLQERQTTFLRAAKTICFDTQNAEDVLQEALADVYQKWARIKKHDNPEAYLMRVMISRHRDMRRKWLRKQEEKETSWELVESIRAIGDKSDEIAERLLVQSALKSLTAIQRAVLVLIYEHGLPLREVAVILEIPLGTAASHLARAKAAVAAHLEVTGELQRTSKRAIEKPESDLEIELERVIVEAEEVEQ
jgi:RNA polymerase sigma factor (sigma-70 family)